MSEKPAVFILDSYAMLALLEGERGAERVRAVLEAARRVETLAYLSLINLGEVLYIIERERGLITTQKTLAAVEQLPLEILPVTRKRVLEAAHIKANSTVAYSDAFVIAAAQEFQATILTGDPEFVQAESFVRVEWL